MKTGPALLFSAALGCCTVFTILADGLPKLSVSRTNAALTLSWPGLLKAADGSTARPYFELQHSSDLRLWQPVGERQRVAATAPTPSLGVAITLDQPDGFYRLLSVDPQPVANLATGGAEVFGYGDAFANELERIGQISPDQFAAKFPTTTNYLPGISWDPTTAPFWEQFNADPEAVNAGKNPDQPGYRFFDNRLSPEELAVFKKNGFVVSERLRMRSFADVFYRLWKDDLPVFISCDALLQAWHRTYDAMLEEVEETYLFNSMQTLLDGMAAQVGVASAQVGNGVLKDSVLDSDYVLTVARSLLAGTNSPPLISQLGQDARVAATLADIQAQQLKQVDDFMGFCRVEDFSQFKVRGHYTHTERLGRYFQCVMWLGRIDVPVAGGPWKRCPSDERSASPRETGLAITLWYLLNTVGRFDTWRDMEKIVEAFVGVTDSLTFGQLNGLLAGAGIQTLADIPDLATLERLQTDIVSGQLGVQNIRSDWFEQPLGGAARYALPQTFTVFGQKFVPDSWGFSQSVFSSILWVENGGTNKVQRRVPGALDVAFSVLANDQIVPELVAQMTGRFPNPDRPHALQFRDGLPYQHNLAAVRAVMDSVTPSTWTGNIYMSWLACLRDLSKPTTGTAYPEAMRTRAWAMKTLNTQLASWTHLRHDTILYAKQSYTDFGECVYPKAFVEPRSEFWADLRGTATRAAAQLAALNYQGQYNIVTNRPPTLDPTTGDVIDPGGPQTNVVSLTIIQQRQVVHLQNFAGVVSRLEELTAKELAQQPFSSDDLSFIDQLMEEGKPASAPQLGLSMGAGLQNAKTRTPQSATFRAKAQSIGLMSGGPMAFTGWYPGLFYRTIYWQDNVEFHGNYGAEAPDALVADVHTDVPNDTPPDPGSVLHEAVGHVNLLMLAVDSSNDRFICAGPVLSHYEFEVIGPPRRISDEEWGGLGFGPGILDGNFPPDLPASRMQGLAPPVWTQSYLVP